MIFGPIMFRFNEVRKLSLMNFFLHLYFLSPVAVFFFQQRGLNYFQILALESVLVFFIVLFELPTGIFADRFGRKKSIVIGTLLLALEPLIYLFADNFLWFALAFALAGMGITFHSGSIEALIYDHLKAKNLEKDMKKAMGSFGSASLVAMVVAPIIGSYIAKDLIMPQFIFLILMSLGAMLIGFFISLWIKDTKQRRVEEENPFSLMKDGAKLIRKNKSLLRIILLSVFASPFLFTLNYLYQPYLLSSGINTALFGTIFAIALLLAASLQKYAYKIEEKLGIKWTVFLATMLPGVFYIIMAFTFHPIWAILLFVMIRATMGLKEPLFSDYKNLHITSKNRATILSMISIIISLYLVGMRLIIGRLADINLSYSFLFMGVVIVIASIFLRIDESHVKTDHLRGKKQL
jgi:MFS family permease